ncbi:NlpC/P60 family protein [Sandaracinobacter sp. RS1-74]|uniref:C40 family peptidase n=1 Tax=Sandaracinobacteroides sayramensis TaxID=2913411 RepID=UPI001EDA938E|nr:NlpC/P60 family protein [Sandaracinobacteroides sayramensis]MCG2840462.1 NlpC/P60 family protein [Sandaracinobacteroides sayramensis]
MKTSRITGPREAGPLGPLDPRDHAWRADLADLALADRVAVASYVVPMEMRALRQVPVLGEDRADAVAVSELLPGEGFAVLDSGHGFAWGYSTADRYVGHVALDALGPALPGKSARIGPGDALLFREPAIKSEVLGALPLGARVQCADAGANFVRLTAGPGEGLHLHRRHILAGAADWVEIALSFRGAPYRWGGRSRAGVDCSGLIQIARQVAGHGCRRDSDMIFADAPDEVAPADARRGDIAWWPGHIGILLDARTLLHANAHWMACVVEPLADVVARAGAEPGLRRF